MPAALLPLKEEWEAVSYGLPAATCLIILPDHNPKTEEQMKIVAQVFESRGRKVKVLRETDLCCAR